MTALQSAHSTAFTMDKSTYFQVIVESSDDAIIAKTLDGIVLSWNEAAERIFGYSADEMIGQPLILIFPPERVFEEGEILSRIARGEKVDHFRTQRLHRDGRLIDVSVTISPLIDSTGRVVGASSISRDISGIVQAERKLLDITRKARHFELIVENSHDAVISKSLEGVITTWNRGAERLFGFTADEIVGQPVTCLFPSDRLHEEREILAQISRGERVEHFETRRVRRDGTLIDVSVTISPVTDEQGKIIGASKIARDITDRRLAEQVIWRKANYDVLTGLPNRHYFSERLTEEIAHAAAHGKQVIVMFIDLDRFKEINDTLGHQAGDALLTAAAERIQQCVRGTDVVSRMGGDEFTIMLTGSVRNERVDGIASDIITRLRRPFLLGDDQVYISGSIGISNFPGDGEIASDLIKHADQAMFEAKKRGRNQSLHFSKDMQYSAQARMQLARDLRAALEHQQLSLNYQPIVALDTGEVIKIEALLRWTHPVRGPISPIEFIPLAEEIGLIHELGEWVFDVAVRQLKLWNSTIKADLQIAINLSPAQFMPGHQVYPGWAEKLSALGVPGHNLVVEITENLMLDNSESTLRQLLGLRDAGIQVAIDDFGTGYSSLAYLRKLKCNYIKIDQSFTRALGPGTDDLALCEAIVTMAHKLGLGVIAEGVETPEQLALLRDIRCDLIQGYLVAKPLTGGDFETWMADRRPWHEDTAPLG